MKNILVLFLPCSHALILRNPYDFPPVSTYDTNPYSISPYAQQIAAVNPYANAPQYPPGYHEPIRPVAPMDSVSGASPTVLPPQVLYPKIQAENQVPTLVGPNGRAELRDYADRNDMRTGDPYEWYPAQAPADFLPGSMRPPNAPIDVVKGGGMARRDRQFFGENARREETRELFESILTEFSNIDTSQDELLQWEEFRGFLVDSLGRSELTAGKLFARLHRDTSSDIEQVAFVSAAADGLPLETPEGLLPDKFDEDNFPVQLTHLKPVYAGMPLGFWSDWDICPLGQVALGANLQTQPFSSGADNSGVVAIGLVCGHGKNGLVSIDGVNEISKLRSGVTEDQVHNFIPNSYYSDYNFCNNGTQISGVRLQSQPYAPHDDNSGFTNVQFECSEVGATEGHSLLFEDPNVSDYPPGTPTREAVEARAKLVNSVSVQGLSGGKGRWSPILLRCGPEDGICGLRTRFRRQAPYFDEMGVVDAEFLCCPAS